MHNWIVFTLSFIVFISCRHSEDNEMVLQRDALKIQKVCDGVFMHTSYLQSERYGKVPCNGMIVMDGQQAVIYDTPVDSTSSKVLLDWIDSLGIKINAVVITHFHVDCIGGLKNFHVREIPSFCNSKTMELVDTAMYVLPQQPFENKIAHNVGSIKVESHYLGAGHTTDNVVAHVPSKAVLFGGCLIKSLKSGKGNLNDADVEAWPKTVMNVKDKFPDLKFVIPGHGKFGDEALLDYTIALMSN